MQKFDSIYEERKGKIRNAKAKVLLRIQLENEVMVLRILKNGNNNKSSISKVVVVSLYQSSCKSPTHDARPPPQTKVYNFEG